MTTAVAEPAQEAPAEDATERDTFTRDLIRESVKAARKGARSTTAVNLGHAERLVMAIEHEVSRTANSLDDVKSFRLQTIGLFSGPLSRAECRAITAKQLDEYVTVHYLIGCLPADSQTLARRCPWDALRILIRWASHLHGSTVLVKGEQYEESWEIKAGCEEKIVELIATLAKHPMSRDGLRDAMDAHERAINGIEEKTAPDDFAVMSKFVTGISKGADKINLSRGELAYWLLRLGVVKYDQVESARKIILDEEAKKTAKKTAPPVGPTLNATTTPNPDPLAVNPSRDISAPLAKAG